MLTIARTGLDGLRSLTSGFIKNERAQDVFEYVLIIGIITVAVLIAVATPVGKTMIQAIVDGTCNALDTVSDAANGAPTGNGFITAAGCAAIFP